MTQVNPNIGFVQFPKTWVDYYHSGLQAKSPATDLSKRSSMIMVERGKFKYEYQDKKYNRPLKIQRDVKNDLVAF